MKIFLKMSEVMADPQFVPDKFLLMERKYELAIEKIKEELSQQIKSLNDQIVSLNSEINDLRVKLDSVKSIQVNKIEPQQRLVVEPSPAVVEKVVEKNDQSQQQHPRQGNFKSEDVPIEKYFYFGNKKFN